MILGTPIDSAVVVTRPGRQRYAVDLKFPSTEELHLSVAYANASSPKAMGLSPDERQLAVRWFNLTLQTM